MVAATAAALATARHGPAPSVRQRVLRPLPVLVTIALASSLVAWRAFVTSWRQRLAVASPLATAPMGAARLPLAPATQPARGTSRIQRHGLSDPPTREAPPEVGNKAGTREAPWAECLVRYAAPPLPSGAAGADAQEVWVFRRHDFEEFQRLIGLRLSYRPPSSGEAEELGPMRFGSARRDEAMASTKVSCRDRDIDSELVCQECTRVFTGGAYEDKAISVPAHPPKPNVLDCLALSTGEEDAPDKQETEGSPLKQTAFCNYVNVRFSAVEL